MIYKFVILSFLLTSCANYSANFEKKPGYSASGFAYIEKNTSLNLKSDNFFISHNKLKTGTKIRIINPVNKKSLEVIMKKKIAYDNFYKALISKSIAEKLNLSLEFPFVEINEIKLNKSFVAKKAVTDSGIRRLIFEAGENLDALLILCRADITSKNESKVIKYLSNFDRAEKRCIEVEKKDRLKNWQPPVSGQIIMDTFKIGPSKEVGIIKKAIREAILDGIIENKQKDAYNFMLKTGQSLGLIINEKP